jgi:glycosyltransferase involved in cell wall biosynthesis
VLVCEEERGQTAPEVTVVIPTRNRRRFLEQAVGDALRQVDVSLEVVVVDDGSTDASAVAGIDQCDPRVRVLHVPTRKGVAHARNVGADSAHGEWLAFLDDDDRWAPGKLRAQLDIAAACGADWVYTAALTVDAHDRILFAEMPGEGPLDMPRLLAANPVPGGCSNVVARTELVRSLGAFDEKLSIIADWDLWIRLARNGQPCAESFCSPTAGIRTTCTYATWRRSTTSSPTSWPSTTRARCPAPRTRTSWLGTRRHTAGAATGRGLLTSTSSAGA